MNPFIRPEQQAAWQHLTQLAAQQPLTIEALLADPQRSEAMTHEAAGLTLDATRQRIDDQVLKALLQWAQDVGVLALAERLFRGESVNTTERRAALHVALRGSGMSEPPWGAEISHAVATELDRFLAFAEFARSGQWRGFDGSAITDVVNLGIGGSDLGPRMASQALGLPSRGLAGAVRVHHVSNVDPDALDATLSGLRVHSTAFIVQSKTFTTQETQTLAASARRWLSDGGCPADGHGRHLVAVTARPELARQQGFDPARTFVFWDWVGGRYSVWSAIGLPLAMVIGAPSFRAFLQGAHEMDLHFASASPERNLPLLMALYGVWNSHFLGCKTLNIAPYAWGLSQFVPFVQQLEMESNGKSTHLDGSRVQVSTAPVVWGGLGIDGQHAYFQLIHQGMQRVPMDFIGVRRTLSTLPLAQQQQQVALLNLQAQAQALALGRGLTPTLAALRAEGLDEHEAQRLAPHRTFAGNTPSSILWMDQLDARSLGALIALYEHKVFCQAALWGINAYDQWGVELGKTMVKQMSSARG